MLCAVMVNTDYIVRGGNRLVSIIVKTVPASPSNVIYDRAHSAIAEVFPDDFDWDKIFEDCEWFHTTGITPALSENMSRITIEAVKAVKNTV